MAIDSRKVAVGAVIMNDDNDVLIGKRGPNTSDDNGLWDFFGGKVELGESCENAIKREIKQELGIEVDVLKLINLVENITDDAHWLNLCYLCEIKDGELQIMEKDKFSQIMWISPNDIVEEGLTKAAKQNLEAFYDLLL